MINLKKFLSFFPTSKTVKASEENVPDREEQAKGLETGYEAEEEKQSSSPFGTLSYSELREVYLRSSAVRNCVNAITRLISSLPWVVRAKPGGDPVHATLVRDFLLNPNENKESLRTILVKVLTDLLVIDAGAIEKVKSRSGKLLELYARDGATFTPVFDIHGSLIEYVQRAHGKTVHFKPDEVVYLQFYPRTWDFYGTPIIETITQEIAALMFSIVDIGTAFTRDEIPPGILALDKIGEIAYRRIKQDLASEKGQAKKKLRILRNAGDVKWIELKRPFREMQIAELNSKIEAVVRTSFGIEDEEMTVSEPTVRSLTQLISYFFNREIMNEFFPDVYFKIIPLVSDRKRAQADEAESRSVKNLVTADVIDREEGRNLIADRFLLPEESLD